MKFKFITIYLILISHFVFAKDYIDNEPYDATTETILNLSDINGDNLTEALNFINTYGPSNMTNFDVPNNLDVGNDINIDGYINFSDENEGFISYNSIDVIELYSRTLWGNWSVSSGTFDAPIITNALKIYSQELLAWTNIHTIGAGTIGAGISDNFSESQSLISLNGNDGILSLMAGEIDIDYSLITLGWDLNSGDANIGFFPNQCSNLWASYNHDYWETDGRFVVTNIGKISEFTAIKLGNSTEYGQMSFYDVANDDFYTIFAGDTTLNFADMSSILMGNASLGNISDPPSDDHIGDRGYNDSRYVERSTGWTGIYTNNMATETDWIYYLDGQVTGIWNNTHSYWHQSPSP